MTTTQMPLLARQSSPESPNSACMHAAGAVLTGFATASTAPLDRTQAPGWLVRRRAVKVKAPCGEVWNEISETELNVVIVWSGGNRWGRIHSGMATWMAAKMARVTA